MVFMVFALRADGWGSVANGFLNGVGVLFPCHIQEDLALGLRPICTRLHERILDTIKLHYWIRRFCFWHNVSHFRGGILLCVVQESTELEFHVFYWDDNVLKLVSGDW